MTIEAWYPRSRRGHDVSMDELDIALKAHLDAELHDYRSAVAIRNIVTFVRRLHDTTGVQGVSFHNISQPPAGDNFYIGVLAPLRRGSEESAKIVREVCRAHADLAVAIQPVMETGLNFYNGVHLGQADFVRSLREESRRSRTKKLGGVFLFRH